MSVAAEPVRVREEATEGATPLWVHREWTDLFPWLVQGTTSAGRRENPFDLGLFGGQPAGEVLGRWQTLRAALGMRTAVHSNQVHGAELLRHASPLAPGLLITQGYDGHLTSVPDILLAISVADCVPVSLVAPHRRSIALVHAGWRGTAAGIVERAADALADENGGLADLWAHCGPSICGECYEVGPEVHAAVSSERSVPEVPEPIDLRRAIAIRLARIGVPMERISLSTHCTRCGDGEFFSHRGGSSGRQMGVLGIREPEG